MIKLEPGVGLYTEEYGQGINRSHNNIELMKQHLAKLKKLILSQGELTIINFKLLNTISVLKIICHNVRGNSTECQFIYLVQLKCILSLA